MSTVTVPITDIFVGKHMCSFCRDDNHELCPRVILNGGKIGMHLLQCPCESKKCSNKVLRCRDCKNETQDDINPKTWLCLDRSACEVRVQKRLAEDPIVQRIRKSQERAMAEKEAKPKKVTAPKEGKCIVTGKKTKGGKFAPGMDARYVSNQVASVIGGEKSKTAVLKEFKDNELSDTLVAKFEKQLGLAQEREAAKKANDKAKADAKKAKAKA